jgi:hypothetical protein
VGRSLRRLFAAKLHFLPAFCPVQSVRGVLIIPRLVGVSSRNGVFGLIFNDPSTYVWAKSVAEMGGKLYIRMQRQSSGEPIDKAPCVRETRYWSYWIVLTAIGQRLSPRSRCIARKEKTNGTPLLNLLPRAPILWRNEL